jgi:hypothetical protein
MKHFIGGGFSQNLEIPPQVGFRPIKVLTKHFIGVAVLVALALACRFWLFSRFSLDIHVHDAYYAMPIRMICFWLLMGVAAVWFVIAVHKFGRS